MLTLVSPLLHTPPPSIDRGPPSSSTPYRGQGLACSCSPRSLTVHSLLGHAPVQPGTCRFGSVPRRPGAFDYPKLNQKHTPPPMLQWRCVSGALCLGRGLSQRLKPSGCSVNLEAKGGCCCRLAHSATFNYCTLWFGPSVHRPLLSCPKESLRLN